MECRFKSQPEKDGAKDAIKIAKAEWMSRADTNGDGEISKDEWLAMKDEYKKEKGSGVE
jgi:hypothetical protein